MGDVYERTKTEVKTETKQDSGGSSRDACKKEKTVTTERTVAEEKERDPVVIIKKD